MRVYTPEEMEAFAIKMEAKVASIDMFDTIVFRCCRDLSHF